MGLSRIKLFFFFFAFLLCVYHKIQCLDVVSNSKCLLADMAFLYVTI